jgi:hypothetical protein
MLLNKRRTPFGWRANITKKLLHVERDCASCQHARILLASRIDLDRQTRCFCRMVCVSYNLKQLIALKNLAVAA